MQPRFSAPAGTVGLPRFLKPGSRFSAHHVRPRHHIRFGMADRSIVEKPGIQDAEDQKSDGHVARDNGGRGKFLGSWEYGRYSIAP